MPSSEIIKDYGWREPETWAHAYILPAIIKIIRELRLSSDAKILDAGCGEGYLIHELYKRGYKDAWGFDVSESGIKVAKENYRDISNRFEVHNAYHTEFPNSFPKKDYDIILSVEVIEHMYSPKEYLKNINFWLKKDGFLIITTPYHGYVKNLAIALLDKIDKHFDPLQEGGHIKFFSKNTLCRLLEEVGMRPMKFYGSGRLPFLWKSMIVVGQK